MNHTRGRRAPVKGVGDGGNRLVGNLLQSPPAQSSHFFTRGGVIIPVPVSEPVPFTQGRLASTRVGGLLAPSRSPSHPPRGLGVPVNLPGPFQLPSSSRVISALFS